MRFNYIKVDEANTEWKDKKGNVWNYISDKHITKEISLSDIIGDVGINKNDRIGSLYHDNKRLSLRKVNMRIPFGKKIIGYIPCVDEDGNNRYVRILKGSFIPVLLPLVLIALILGGVFFWQNSLNNKPFLDEAAIAYQMPDGVKNENPNEIMMPVFTEIEVKEDGKSVEAGLANPEGNPCYFKYQIILKDKKEVLYESKWIEPGNAVTKFKLNRKLEKGKYPITIKITTGSLSDHEQEMNGGEIEAVFKVN